MSDDEVYDWDAQLRKLDEITDAAGVPESISKVQIAEWQLDKDGIAIKGCAIGRPEGTRYGLIIARRDAAGNFDDPRDLTREQIQAIHDFTGFMLEDSEG
jgi:hypothetical protein